MLPGKKYAIEDVLPILRRRLWVILVPAAVVAALASLQVQQLPNLYTSYTTIMVVPQRISESIVRNTITVSIEDRLPSIRAAVLSRTSLESVILEFDLYPELRRTRVMEDVVEVMERHIDTSTSSVRNAFEVSFTSEDPVKAMQVAERLGGLFIDQSLSYRHNLIEDTNEFLEAQLEEKRRELELVEQRLANYQRQHASELPSQQSSNIQQLTSANVRVQAALDSINRSRERRLTLEKLLADLETAPASAPLPGGEPRSGSSTLDQLTAAQQALANLEARGLKPGHPDLEAARRVVRDLSTRLESEERTPSVAAPVSAVDAARRGRIREVQAEIAEVDRQIALARVEEQQARERAQAAQARIDASPTREAELIALTRDYDIIESSYRGLLAKREEARISANLERQQVGEQFRIVDAARLPERPSSPDRMRLNGMALVFGLGLGVVLAGILEFRDRTIRTDADLALVLDLPVLAVVPVMESPRERRWRVWKRMALTGGCTLVVLGGFTVFVYTLVG